MLLSKNVFNFKNIFKSWYNILTYIFRVFNVNVRSVYQLTALAVPHLIKTKGNIVNVSSITGLRSFSGALAYCMSKSAVDQFTHCIALELGPKQVCTKVKKILHKHSGNLILFLMFHILLFFKYSRCA